MIRALSAFIVLASVVLAASALAQTTGIDVVDRSANDLIDRGVLGIFVVVEAVAIVTLIIMGERKAAAAAAQLQKTNEMVIAYASKGTEQLANNTAALANNTAALNACREQSARSDAIQQRIVERLDESAYRAAGSSR